MPRYEYNCPECGVIEKKMPMKDWDLQEITCDCGKEAKKFPSRSMFELKGGGWYDSGYTKGD